MWKLLKENTLYNNTVTTVIIIISIQLALYSFLKIYDNVNALITILVLIIFLSKISERNNEKLNRQNILLPISVKSIGLSRSLLILVPWIILIPVLIIINYLILPESFDEILTLVGQLGFVIVVPSSYVILRDIYFQNASNKTNKFIIVIITSLFLLVGTVFIVILADLFDPKLSEGKGVIIIYAWGILLTFLSVMSFIKRKSYLT